MKVSALAFGLLFFLLAIASAFGFLLKPVTLADQSFYLSLAWLNVLVVINWFVALYFFPQNRSENQTQTVFGILPSLQVVTFIYSITTLGLLVYFWLQSEFQSLSRLHWVLQVVIAGVYGVIVFLALIASKTAELPIPDKTLISKQELLLKLSEWNRFLASQNADTPEMLEEVKTLERIINYSIPHLSALKSVSNYSEFSSELHKFCTEKHVNNALENLRGLVRMGKDCR